MQDSPDPVRFEMLVLPHLDAAYNLARWLLRSGADAEDVAQEAPLRSYRFFHNFQGGDVRAWLLQIVRNTCYTHLEKNRRVKDMTEFDEQLHGPRAQHPKRLPSRVTIARASPTFLSLCRHAIDSPKSCWHRWGRFSFSPLQ